MDKKYETQEFTFDEAMALKEDGEHDDISDAAFYVVSVIQLAIMIEGLKIPDDYRLCICPPNPEIVAYFERRIPPQFAAIELFRVTH